MKKIRWVFYTVVLLIVATGVTEKHLSDSNRIVSKISTTHKVVALTIDDGPHNKVTPEILAVLKEKQVRATFFVLGKSVENFPEVLAQEVSDGHEIGMHTYSHPSLPGLSAAKIAEEFDKAESIISAIAPKPVLFRPPGGFYNSQVLEAAGRRGYTVILWSIDPKDWSCPPGKQMIEQVFREVKPGSIILLHDGQHPLPTPKALGTIIDGLHERGYSFVTVSELLQYSEVRHTSNFFSDFF